jgi:hypothetical protein
MTAGLLIAAHVFAPPRVTYCRMAVDHRARIQPQQRQCQSHLPTPYRCLDSRTHVPYARDMVIGLGRNEDMGAIMKNDRCKERRGGGIGQRDKIGTVNYTLE